jgi:adenylate kinase family enzyme
MIHSLKVADRKSPWHHGNTSLHQNAMQKVAVFGNAGGGKSTLSKRLAEITGLPLYPLDKVEYLPGGIPITPEEFQQRHQTIVDRAQWIIDGFGSIETLWPRLDRADTLIYVDLPLPQHFLWVTKRFLKGLLQTPEGWPEGSSIVAGSINSYQVLWLCHKKLTPKYRAYAQQAKNTKTVYHLRSSHDIAQFLATIAQPA